MVSTIIASISMVTTNADPANIPAMRMSRVTISTIPPRNTPAPRDIPTSWNGLVLSFRDTIDRFLSSCHERFGLADGSKNAEDDRPGTDGAGRDG